MNSETKCICFFISSDSMRIYFQNHTVVMSIMGLTESDSFICFYSTKFWFQMNQYAKRCQYVTPDKLFELESARKNQSKSIALMWEGIKGKKTKYVCACCHLRFSRKQQAHYEKIGCAALEGSYIVTPNTQYHWKTVVSRSDLFFIRIF